MMKKRILSLFLCVMMVVSMVVVPAQAEYEPKYTKQADMLYEMGLFRGTGTNPDGTPIYALGNSATRMQGLIMLIRLLGEEEEALAYTGECPFTDVSGNSAKYAGYAYSKGYTTGTTATTFGNGPLKPNAFLTFVLRALGYNDKAGDFKYSTAFAKAAEVGIIAPGEYVNQTYNLLRDGCVQIAFNALKTRVKGTTKTLAETLIASGAIDSQKADQSGFTDRKSGKVFSGNRNVAALYQVTKAPNGTEALKNAKYYGLPEDISWNDNPQTDLDHIYNALYAYLLGNYNLNFHFDSQEDYLPFAFSFGNNQSEVQSTFPELMGVFANGGDVMTQFGSGSDQYFYSIIYRNAPYSNREIYLMQQEALAKALEISQSLHNSGRIKEGMSQREIIQVYYNYMTNYGVKPHSNWNSIDQAMNMKYDTAYSALIQKESACLGRAAAFNLFMHIEGIPAMGIACHDKSLGEGQNHGMTYLVLDGEEYVVDWGNYFPLQTLEQASSRWQFFDYSLNLCRTILLNK